MCSGSIITGWNNEQKSFDPGSNQGPQDSVVTITVLCSSSWAIEGMTDYLSAPLQSSGVQEEKKGASHNSITLEYLRRYRFCFENNVKLKKLSGYTSSLLCDKHHHACWQIKMAQRRERGTVRKGAWDRVRKITFGTRSTSCAMQRYKAIQFRQAHQVVALIVSKGDVALPRND